MTEKHTCPRRMIDHTIAKQIELCDKAVAYCRDIGIELEPWQEATLRATLRGESYMKQDAADAEAEALERRLKNDPLHKLYLANKEAGIQHDGGA